ncbi:uncharacterized protein PRCAT00005933001 [Priceomyces carsonii]|uniref:uncharacterized protein n=1 Tax=Priceomyces carsonii TaxID=28549 RepID=UPI002ED91330|nr:unnamed protein product [Priceomyces carsonii]
MSDQSNKQSTTEQSGLQQNDLEKKIDKDSMLVEIGGEKVPYKDIRWPHHVVLKPESHMAKQDPYSFPKVEPDAKKREEELEAARAKNHELK